MEGDSEPGGFAVASSRRKRPMGIESLLIFIIIGAVALDRFRLEGGMRT